MVKETRGRKYAVEQSYFRKEVDEMLREGKSPDFISKYLKSNGECISRSSIYRYKKGKFNIHKESVMKYNEKHSKHRLDTASDEIVDDIEDLDNQLKELEKSGIDYSKLSDYQKANVYVRLKQTKKEYLKSEDTNVDVNIRNDLNALFDDKLIDEVLNDDEESIKKDSE